MTAAYLSNNAHHIRMELPEGFKVQLPNLSNELQVEVLNLTLEGRWNLRDSVLYLAFQDMEMDQLTPAVIRGGLYTRTTLLAELKKHWSDQVLFTLDPRGHLVVKNLARRHLLLSGSAPLMRTLGFCNQLQYPGNIALLNHLPLPTAMTLTAPLAFDVERDLRTGVILADQCLIGPNWHVQRPQHRGFGYFRILARYELDFSRGDASAPRVRIFRQPSIPTGYFRTSSCPSWIKIADQQRQPIPVGPQTTSSITLHLKRG